jgi:hypothetical protein
MKTLKADMFFSLINYTNIWKRILTHLEPHVLLCYVYFTDLWLVCIFM